MSSEINANQSTQLLAMKPENTLDKEQGTDNIDSSNVNLLTNDGNSVVTVYIY